MKRFLVIAVCLLMFFSSCEKKEVEGVSTQDEQEQVDSSVLKNISYPTPQNVVVYEVDPSIMAHFRHYCQKSAGPVTTNYPNAEAILSDYMASRSCGATSYMMAAGCIAKFLDPNTGYAVNGTKLSNIVSQTGVSVSLSKPLAYGKVYDNSFIKVADNFGYYPTSTNLVSPKIAEDRTNTKVFMQNALANNQFVIAAVNVYGTYAIVNDSKFYSSVNSPDLNPTGTVTTGSNKNYMTDKPESTYAVVGHIILIVKITVNLSTGEGVVEYIDPLALTRISPLSNRRYVSYTRLLNSMSANGSTANYDAISVGRR